MSTDQPARPAGPVPVRLYLVRHGETAWSLSGRHTGRTDIALTERGRNQARALRAVLAPTRFDRVLVSPSRRARQTCFLAGLGDAAEEEPDLAEWNYGAYEGRVSSDIRSEQPGWNVYRDGCPGGETPADVSVRADRLITRLRTLGGDIALFSHGQIGSCLAVRWIGLPIIEGEHFVLGTAAVGILGSNPGHPDLPVITAWNLGASRDPPHSVCRVGAADDVELRTGAVTIADDPEGELRDAHRRVAVAAGSETSPDQDRGWHAPVRTSQGHMTR